MQRSAMTTLAGKMMLGRSPLFRGLPPEILDRVAELAAQRSYRSGDVVFIQGDPGDALFGVVKGKIRISAGTSVGKEIFLNIMEPGDTFGEIALLDGGTRTASPPRLERPSWSRSGANTLLQCSSASPAERSSSAPVR